MSLRVRSLLVLLTAFAVLAPSAAVADAKLSAKAKAKLRALATQECVDADLEPAAGNLDRVRHAVLCLHNKLRAQRNLPSLKDNSRLRRAATGHSRTMVTAGYFDHTTPQGVTMVDRILRAGYVRDGQGWMLGENIAWGTGSLGTPRGTVKAWMASPGHRANILKRGYRELGVGVGAGVPVSDAAGATYTVDFGVRR